MTELGMFHTVLLETGKLSDAGPPTGRRVTFTNQLSPSKGILQFFDVGPMVVG